MEDVESVLKRCIGLIDTSRMKPLVELLRALRERLTDSQSNLKPVAARLIGSILGSADAAAQGKLGKVVYGPLINAAMNDNKKNMHDATMESLRVGTSLAPIEGEGANDQALEAFIHCLVGELDESEFKVSSHHAVLGAV
jgi:cytoskeleton-associated protein 5